MEWESNQYYRLTSAGQEAVQVATSLLQAYPLTQACLGILKNKLIDTLEFGFFTEGMDIIREGESGKDVFLMCSGKVDVLVDDKVIVQMDAPILLGDKAIVQPDSKRAATIRVAHCKTALWIKIPMGFFIHNFNDKAIPDDVFKQETEIFCNIYKGIQERLFEYAYIQKNLWEEVNTTLNLVNCQLIAKILDNKKEMSWGEPVWLAVRRYLEREIKWAWPRTMQMNTSIFRDVMMRWVEHKYPRELFKGTDEEYLVKKFQTWRSLLTNIGGVITRVLPEESMPFQINDLELLNPRVYRMRITNILRQVEKRFAVKKNPQSAFPGEEQGASAGGAPSISQFFGKGEHATELDIKRYLKSFEQSFELQYPQRIKAQVAQRTALAAAECENQFNNSIIKMNGFLEKAKSKTSSISPSTLQTKASVSDIRKYVNGVLKGFPSFNHSNNAYLQRQSGRVQYYKNVTPNIQGLLKCVAVKGTRSEVEQSYKKLIEALGIKGGGLSQNFIRKNLYLFEINPGEFITDYELKKHYWIPLEPGYRFMDGESNILGVDPGILMGGPGWNVPEEGSEPELTPHLQAPAYGSSLLFVIPQSVLPWEDEQASVDFDEFIEQYVPIMQWLVDRQTEHTISLIDKRNNEYQKYHDVQHLIFLEEQLKAFETTRVQLDKEQQSKIIELLGNMIGLNVPSDAPIKSDQLSKKIYNHILIQMGEDYPEMNLEDRGNKAYTKWRFILSEIVNATGNAQSNSQMREDEQGLKPVLEIISMELNALARGSLLDGWSNYNKLTEEEPHINLDIFKREVSNVQTKVVFFKQIMQLMSQHAYQLFMEAKIFTDKSNAANSQRPGDESEELKLEMIRESVRRLTRTLTEG